jgi:hypothetical protein
LELALAKVNAHANIPVGAKRLTRLTCSTVGQRFAAPCRKTHRKNCAEDTNYLQAWQYWKRIRKQKRPVFSSPRPNIERRDSAECDFGRTML